MVVFSHFASSFRLRIHPPSSFLARKSTPVWESVTDVVPKFGQARTPSWTIPSTIKARQTAYCSLRRKPRVPSIGSIVHDRPVGPPVCEPRSRAVSTLRDSGRVEVHRIKDISRGQPFGSVRSRSDPPNHRNAPKKLLALRVPLYTVLEHFVPTPKLLKRGDGGYGLSMFWKRYLCYLDVTPPF